MEIVIVHISIDGDKDLIFKTAKKDKVLIQEIDKKKKELQEQDIEVFAQKDNIIVTEKGYYAAFWKNNIPS